MKLDNPENLQMSIKEAKNLLTITEQDTIRLADLREKLEGDIKGLLTSKDNVQKELDEVTIKLKVIKKELSLVEVNKNDLADQIKKQQSILEEVNTKIKEKEESLNEREERIKNLEYINIKANENVEERSVIITQREQVIKDKEQLIKEFCNKLCQ